MSHLEDSYQALTLCWTEGMLLLENVPSVLDNSQRRSLKLKTKQLHQKLREIETLIRTGYTQRMQNLLTDLNAECQRLEHTIKNQQVVATKIQLITGAIRVATKIIQLQAALTTNVRPMLYSPALESDIQTPFNPPLAPLPDFASLEEECAFLRKMVAYLIYKPLSVNDWREVKVTELANPAELFDTPALQEALPALPEEQADSANKHPE